MKKIGILGGTFDPIHLGHIEMGLAAKRALELDQVLFMPSGNPAYKTEKKKVSDKKDRLAMTRLSLLGYPSLVASGLECKREGNTYTADTLNLLREINPEDELYFIVGADSLDYMDQWVRPQEVFDNATIVSIGRSGFSREKDLQKKKELEKEFNAKIVFVEMDPVDVSSTELREKIKNHDYENLLMKKEALSYAIEHHLYDDEVYNEPEEESDFGFELWKRANGPVYKKFTYIFDKPIKCEVEILKMNFDDLADEIRIRSISPAFGPTFQWSSCSKDYPFMSFEGSPTFSLDKIEDVHKVMVGGKEVMLYCIEHFDELTKDY